MHVLKPGLQCPDRLERGIVVGIRAYKEVVVLVIDCRYIVLDHGTDHTVFVPAGDVDSDPSQWRLSKLFFGGLTSGVLREALPDPCIQTNQVQKEIIGAA